jgi:hypothetical protein
MDFKIPSNYAEFGDLSDAVEFVQELNNLLKKGKDKIETLFKFARYDYEDLNILYNHFFVLFRQSEELLDKIPSFIKNNIGLDEEKGPVKIIKPK